MMRNTLQGNYIEDPFFAAHRNHMMSMGSMFQMPGPFSPPVPQIVDSRTAERDRRNRRHPQQHHHQQHRHHQGLQQLQMQPAASPFSMMSIGFGGMLANMDRMMSDMHNRFEQPLRSPQANGGQNFVQSSFVSYSNVGNGAPRVYQSSVTQRARGGVVETNKTERDSTTGVEKVVIAHKIGDREHKVERARNSRTGSNEVNQEYINLDEEEAESFDKEFQEKVCQPMPVKGTDHVRRHRVNPTENHHNYRSPRQILPPRHRSYRDRH